MNAYLTHVVVRAQPAAALEAPVGDQPPRRSTLVLVHSHLNACAVHRVVHRALQHHRAPEQRDLRHLCGQPSLPSATLCRQRPRSPPPQAVHQESAFLGLIVLALLTLRVVGACAVLRVVQRTLEHYRAPGWRALWPSSGQPSLPSAPFCRQRPRPPPPSVAHQGSVFLNLVVRGLLRRRAVSAVFSGAPCFPHTRSEHGDVH